MALSDLLKPFGTSSMGRRSITRESTHIKNAAKRAGLNTQAGQQLMARSAEVRLNEEPSGAMTQDWREASQTAEDIRALQQTGGFDPAKDIKPLQQQWFQSVHSSDRLTEREKQQLRNKYDREFSVLGEQQAKEEERETKSKLDQLSLLSGQQGLLRGQQSLAKGGIDIEQAELNLGASRLDQGLAEQRLRAGDLAYDAGIVNYENLKRDSERQKEGDDLLPELGKFLTDINDRATGRTSYKNAFGETVFEAVETLPPQELQSQLLNHLNKNPSILNSPVAVKMFENAYGRVGGDLNFFRQKVSRDDAFANQMAANSASAGIYISPEDMVDKNTIMKAVSAGFLANKIKAQALVAEKARTYARVRALDHYVNSINDWIKQFPDDHNDLAVIDPETMRSRLTADLDTVRGFLAGVEEGTDTTQISKQIKAAQDEIDAKAYVGKQSKKTDSRQVFTLLGRVKRLALMVNILHTFELTSEMEELDIEDTRPRPADSRFPSK
tara:strand:- start:42 stop:1535 length:1494 start_codon:yes stop_codon:yes gene_type:complete